MLNIDKLSVYESIIMPEKFYPIAKIQTWGAAVGQSRILSFLGKMVNGENIGHASIELQLPVTPENKLLVEKYCCSPANIPYVEKEIGKNSDGTPQHVYIVRFSFIPARPPKNFELNRSYEEDCVYEHCGANTTMRQYLETHELTQRRAGSKIINIYPLYSLTEKGRALDFFTPEGRYVLYQKEFSELIEESNTLEKLKEKMRLIKKFPQPMNHASNVTLCILLKSLGLQYDNMLTQEKVMQILAEAQIVERAQQSRRMELTHLMFAMQNELSPDFFTHLPDYLAKGRVADSEVELPLGDEHGLNAAMMLAQMHDIAVLKRSFNVHNFNCSVVTTSILKAGLRNKTSKVKSKTFRVKTPQTVLNLALSHRDKQIAKSIENSFEDLEKFYADCQEKTLSVVRRDASNLREAILQFAIDSIFPTEGDQLTNQFYLFSHKDKIATKEIATNEDGLVPTELLRDLWGIIPQRTLPLSLDGVYRVLIDQNLTFKNLIQGLTTLAQINATKRLSLSQTLEEETHTESSEPTLNKTNLLDIKRGLQSIKSSPEDNNDVDKDFSP